MHICVHVLMCVHMCDAYMSAPGCMHVFMYVYKCVCVTGERQFVQSGFHTPHHDNPYV